jgi:SAM-dependent methyltransferase
MVTDYNLLLEGCGEFHYGHVNRNSYDVSMMPTPNPPNDLPFASQSENRSDVASYDQSHFPSLFAAEDRHFWFRMRNKVIAALVKRAAARYPAGYRFLEIGCGNGNVLKELEVVCAQGQVIGIDLFIEGLRFARQRVSAPLIQADIYALPFNVLFEMVGLFDVLEHLPDDVDILTHVRESLSPDGLLFITVPAYRSLWSYADRLANHKRRYTREDLERKLGEAGFAVEYASYYMMSMLPIVWLSRKRSNFNLQYSENPRVLEREMFQNELKIRPVMNQFLYHLLMLEIPFIARHFHLPFGTSLVVVARRI